MKMINKIFSKAAFRIAGITYLFTAIVFMFGFLSHDRGGWINFGPVFSGICAVIFAFPFIVLIGTFCTAYEAYRLKQHILFAITVYWVSTVSVAGLFFLFALL